MIEQSQIDEQVVIQSKSMKKGDYWSTSDDAGLLEFMNQYKAWQRSCLLTRCCKELKVGVTSDRAAAQQYYRTGFNGGDVNTSSYASQALQV